MSFEFSTQLATTVSTHVQSAVTTVQYQSIGVGDFLPLSPNFVLLAPFAPGFKLLAGLGMAIIVLLGIAGALLGTGRLATSGSDRGKAEAGARQAKTGVIVFIIGLLFGGVMITLAAAGTAFNW